MPDFFLFLFMLLCSLGGVLSLSFFSPFVFQLLENWPILLELRILSAQEEQCFVTQCSAFCQQFIAVHLLFPLCSALVALQNAQSKLNGSVFISLPGSFTLANWIID